jgi:hypothetical protein
VVVMTRAPAIHERTPGLDLAENLDSLNRLVPAKRLAAAALTVLPEDTWAIEVYLYVPTRLGAWRDLDRRLARSVKALSKHAPVPAHLMFARVRIYDVLGHEVARLHEGVLEPGTHRLTRDGANRRGRAVAPGVYLARAESDGAVTIRRLLRLR